MTQIIIKTHNANISSSVREYVEKKMSKLDLLFEKISEIHVDLDVESNLNQDDRHVVSVTVLVPRTAIISKQASASLYASIDAVLPTLERQLKKYKDKMRLESRKKAMKAKRHIHRSASRTVDVAKKETINPNLLYVKKPMHPEDAALILEDTEQPFLIFRSAADETINVLYITDDGDFGLIET